MHGMWHWTGLGLLFGASLNLESHSEGFVRRLSVEAHSGYPADTQSAIGAAARVSGSGKLIELLQVLFVRWLVVNRSFVYPLERIKPPTRLSDEAAWRRCGREEGSEGTVEGAAEGP